MTHTAGPWHADEHMVVRAANGNIICDVDPFDTFEDKARANLALIAAAPELLQWLLVVLDQVDYERGNCSQTETVGACLPSTVIASARAAIKKAEAA
jgi:hypothetical protein